MDFPKVLLLQMDFIKAFLRPFPCRLLPSFPCFDLHQNQSGMDSVEGILHRPWVLPCPYPHHPFSRILQAQLFGIGQHLRRDYLYWVRIQILEVGMVGLSVALELLYQREQMMKHYLLQIDLYFEFKELMIDLHHRQRNLILAELQVTQVD
jgi:hypothetical protein